MDNKYQQKSYKIDFKAKSVTRQKEEIINENFPNLGKETNIQLQMHRELQTRWTQRGSHQQRVSKLSKIKGKERILKTARVKQLVTYKVTPIRSSADFSAEIL